MPETSLERFVTAMRDAVARLYPSFADNPDYTSIVNDRHHARLAALLDDARALGARIVPLGPPNEFPEPGSRKLEPSAGRRRDAPTWR